MAETLNEMVETPNDNKIAKKSYNAKYYNAKIKSNPEFYEKERKRVCEYIQNRYNNDEEYKKKILQYKKEYYQLKKTEKLEKEKIENPAKYLERENRRLKKLEINLY
jgi:hypothetical protein